MQQDKNHSQIQELSLSPFSGQPQIDKKQSTYSQSFNNLENYQKVDLPNLEEHQNVNQKNIDEYIGENNLSSIRQMKDFCEQNKSTIYQKLKKSNIQTVSHKMYAQSQNQPDDLLQNLSSEIVQDENSNQSQLKQNSQNKSRILEEEKNEQVDLEDYCYSNMDSKQVQVSEELQDKRDLSTDQYKQSENFDQSSNKNNEFQQKKEKESASLTKNMPRNIGNGIIKFICDLGVNQELTKNIFIKKCLQDIDNEISFLEQDQTQDQVRMEQLKQSKQILMSKEHMARLKKLVRKFRKNYITQKKKQKKEKDKKKHSDNQENQESKNKPDVLIQKQGQLPNNQTVQNEDISSKKQESSARDAFSTQENQNLVINLEQQYSHCNEQTTNYTPQPQQPQIKEQLKDNENDLEKLTLDKLQSYEKLWSIMPEDSEQVKDTKILFRCLCWGFINHFAPCYILFSKIKHSDTKKMHIKYLYRFLSGIADPKQFYYIVPSLETKRLLNPEKQ